MTFGVSCDNNLQEDRMCNFLVLEIQLKFYALLQLLLRNNLRLLQTNYCRFVIVLENSTFRSVWFVVSTISKKERSKEAQIFKAFLLCTPFVRTIEYETEFMRIKMGSSGKFYISVTMYYIVVCVLILRSFFTHI